MTFRSPLRNEWDRLRPQFEAAAGDFSGHAGVVARAMLASVPPLLDAIERERDALTDPRDLVSAAAAVAGLWAENAIQQAFTTAHMRGLALDHVLRQVNAVVRPRLAAGRAGGLILPEGF